MRKKAVVLLSGGLDSTTVLAIAKNCGFECYALSFLYGQRHSYEIEASKKNAKLFGVKKHLILNIDMGQIGGSALTDKKINVPKQSVSLNTIPVTYVPARNTIFLSYGLAFAEVILSNNIFIGVNAVDYSGYPDCRPEFIKAFEKMANLATKAGVEEKGKIKIQTPLIKLSKEQIIKKGISLGVDYSLTHSCYDPSEDGLACNECDSCIIRKKGFEKAGISDPTLYK